MSFLNHCHNDYALFWFFVCTACCCWCYIRAWVFLYNRCSWTFGNFCAIQTILNLNIRFRNRHQGWKCRWFQSFYIEYILACNHLCLLFSLNWWISYNMIHHSQPMLHLHQNTCAKRMAQILFIAHFKQMLLLLKGWKEVLRRMTLSCGHVQ